jgi:hypothetical protein
MTHSLHREGTIDSLSRDYVLFVYPARGFNYRGSAPRVRRLVEIIYGAGAINLIPTSLRRNMYSGVTPEEILDSITVEGTRVYSVFHDRERLREALIKIKEADQGISIMVSGLIDEVRQLTAELGINPHMVNLSLGIHGRTELLAPPDIREFTTMCGHGVIAPELVKDVLRRVKRGKLSPWEGSLILAEPCACGIYNPYRSVELIEDKLPLYTVSRR